MNTRIILLQINRDVFKIFYENWVFLNLTHCQKITIPF